MGLLDHQRTWRFTARSSPGECLTAFERAFSGGFHVAAAKWKLQRAGDKAVAVYQGRAGLGALVGIASRTAQAEEQTAVGSEVTFTVENVTGDTVTCAMWLSLKGKKFGFTADARFMRPYMQAVEKQLRTLDPGLRVVKE